LQRIHHALYEQCREQGQREASPTAATSALLKLLNRWREEAEKAGHRIERIAIAFEAGRDGGACIDAPGSTPAGKSRARSGMFSSIH
jgi:hypothetical protein